MIGETITIVRPATVTDRYGDTILDWDDTTATPVDGCAVAPAGSTENHETGRDAITERFTVYLPAGTDVLDTDRLQFRGRTYHVEGRPELWVSPYSTLTAGFAVTCARTDG